MTNKEMKSIRFQGSNDTYKVHDETARTQIKGLENRVIALENKEPSGGGISTEYVDNAVASAVNGLASETYVNNTVNGAINGLNIPSVDGLASEEYVNGAIETVDGKIPDVSGLATKAEVEGVEGKIPSVEGLATETYVDEAIASIPKGGLPETEKGIASIIDGGEVKNLFGETTATEKVEKGVTFGKAEYDAGSASKGAAYYGPFYPYKTFLTGKKVHSIGLIPSNINRDTGAVLNPTLPLEIYIRNWGVNDLSTLTSGSSEPSSPAELVCKILPTSADINKYTKFKLDGTDPRVTNINTTYIKNGVLEVPAQYFIGCNCPSANAFNWKYFNKSPKVDVGFTYISNSKNTPSSGTLCLDFYWDEEEIVTKYSFDDYLVKIVQPEPREELVPMKKPVHSTTTATFKGGVYFLRDVSYLNGKYMTGVACQPIKGRFGRFVVGTISNNATNTGNGGTKPASGTAITNIRQLFTIDFSNTGYTSFGQADDIEFLFDGTDPRVTIVATDLFDEEHKGFLWNSTMLFGVDDRSQGASSAETGSLCFTQNMPTDQWYNHINTGLQGGNPSTSESVESTTTSSISVTDLHVVPMYTDIVTPEPYKEIKSGVIKDLIESKPEAESPLKGKWLSMIGDSISTFQGWSNIAPGSTSAAIYYPQSFLNDVNQTYWKKLIDRTGMNLLVNNSWSGSRCSNTGSGPVVSTTNDRCKQLHKTINGVVVNPDYILINIGTNDFDHMSKTAGSGDCTMGTWNGRGEAFPANPDTTAPTSFREAYAVMLHRLRKNYPLAKIFCCTVPCGNNFGGGFDEVNGAGIYLAEFNDAIREIATAFGAHVIELATSGLDYWTLSTLYGDNRLHPSEAGMERYYEIIRKAMENEDSSNVSCPRRSALMTGTATVVQNSVATDVTGVVTDFNALLQTLRDRGIIS